MLITPANQCGSITGLFILGHISQQRPKTTKLPSFTNSNTLFTIKGISKPFKCSARRRVRDDIVGDEDESYGYNEEISMLEIYTQSCREEALIVTAIVDKEEVEVVIFKGVSSCLSGETAVDPARSVLPERAVIQKIDRVKGPFDPLKIDYIQKGISFQDFKESLL